MHETDSPHGYIMADDSVINSINGEYARYLLARYPAIVEKAEEGDPVKLTILFREGNSYHEFKNGLRSRYMLTEYRSVDLESGELSLCDVEIDLEELEKMFA